MDTSSFADIIVFNLSIDEELLNEYFGNDLYFELISLNYKDKYVIDELENLLFSKIPVRRFEEIKIEELL